MTKHEEKKEHSNQEEEKEAEPSTDQNIEEDMKKDTTKETKEEKNTEAIIEKRRKKLFNYIKKHHSGFIIYPLAALIIFFGAFIRTLNLPLLKDKYPLALDPYAFLRYARYIIDYGSVPAIDTMRYVPIMFNTSDENIFVSYVIAYLYKFLNILFPGITLEKADILYPVIFFVLGMIGFFFLVKLIFDSKTALVASLFLTVIPTYLYRTMAGFSDKEPLAMFMLFFTFYFLVKAHQSKKWIIIIPFSIIAGILNGLMALSWGGVKFVLLIVSIFSFVLFIINKLNKKSLAIYTLWLIPLILIMSFLTPRYGGLIGVITSLNIGIPVIVLVIFVIHFFIKPLTKKINFPEQITTILLIIILGLILGFIFAPNIVIGGLSAAKDQLLHPMGTSRVMLTVAESRQPYFSDWWSNYGFYFFLFFFGSMFLFYELVSPLKKSVKSLTIVFIIFISAFIFSRKSANSILNGTNTISQLMFFGSLALISGVILAAIIYSFYKDKELYKKISKLDSKIIFLFIWFLIMVIAARGAVRLFFVFTPVNAVISAYLILKVFRLKLHDKAYKYFAIIIVLLIAIPSLSSFASSSYYQASYTGPSFNQQWQTSMEWVRLHTQKDAVFAHWWDYGYWVQTGGNRSTILDGGNYLSYWNHLLARHVLTGKNNKDALEFLYVHNTTHLLIISDEIGKYTAYSSIGADENYDTFSWIGTFALNPRLTIVDEEKNLTTYTFQGGTGLDEDLIYNGKVFPAKQSYITSFQVPVKNEDDPLTLEILQPKAFVSYEGLREQVPIECIYDEGYLRYNDSGIQGCIRIMPHYINQYYQQENGALLWVSRRGISTLWTRLFLFNEQSPNFELVYDDSGVNTLALYRGNIVGPLKIWQIKYPGNFTVNASLSAKYLNKTTPEWMNLSRRSVWDEMS